MQKGKGGGGGGEVGVEGRDKQRRAGCQLREGGAWVGSRTDHRAAKRGHE